MARVERKDAAALEDATPDGRRGLIDGCGRRIDHLRLSVTSACDLRCTYCRPARISDEQTRGTTLADSQRVEFVKFLHEAYSLEQVRITGGEPLLYRGVVSLIDAIRRAVPGVALAMTTNGRLLPRTASALRRAGLARLNLSLDSLDADRYHEITGGRLEDVLAGFEAAQAAGFPPPRINAVVLRHVNDDEMGALVRWALARGSEIRFLEAMPIGPAAEANRRALVSASEIRAKLAEHFTLKPLPHDESSTARRFLASWNGHHGVVGVISPVTESFCSGCRRMRLTADGRLLPCLLDARSVNIAAAWRGDVFSGAEADTLIRAAVAGKQLQGHRQLIPMVSLGG